MQAEQRRAPSVASRVAARMRLQRRRLTAWMLSVALFALLVGAWEWFVTSQNVPTTIFPTPLAVWDSFVADLQRGLYFTHTWITLREVLAGFVVGAVVGTVVGILIAELYWVRRIIYPYIVAFQNIPKVALAPLFLVWFGFGMLSKVALAVSITFFPVLVNVVKGMSSPDREQLELLRAYCASPFQVLLRLKLPMALPYLFAGLEIAIVLSVIAAVIAEFVGATGGLGYLILLYNSRLDMAAEFAAIGVLAGVGFVLHWLVQQAGRKAVFWAERDDSEVGI